MKIRFYNSWKDRGFGRGIAVPRDLIRISCIGARNMDWNDCEKGLSLAFIGFEMMITILVKL